MPLPSSLTLSLLLAATMLAQQVAAVPAIQNAAPPALAPGGSRHSLITALEQTWRWRELRRSDAEPRFSMVSTGASGQLLVADEAGLWRHDGLHWESLSGWPDGIATVADLLRRTDGGFVAARGQQLVSIRDDDPESPITLSPTQLVGQTCQPVQFPDGRLVTADSRQLFIVTDTELRPYMAVPEGTEHTCALGYDDSGRLWITTDHGIYRREGALWRAVPVSGGVAGQAKDIAMILNVGKRLIFLPRVFASRQSGLQWDGTELTPLPTAQAQGQLSDAVVTATGDMLVAIQYSGLRGLCWIDQESCLWKPVNVPPPFDASIMSMTLLPDGRLAVVTHRGRLLVNDSHSTRWATHDPRVVGVSSVVNSIAHSRRGGVWIGTHEGVARFDGEGFVDVFLEAGELRLRLEQITAVHEDASGQLWVGSGSGFQGLLRLDERGWHHEELVGLPGYGVHAMFTDPQGDLWLTMLALTGATPVFRSGAILQRSNDAWIVHDRIGDALMPRVYSLTWQQDGTLLAGARGEIGIYDGNVWARWLPPPVPPDRRAFALIARRNGDLWFGRGRNESGVAWQKNGTIHWNQPDRIRLPEDPPLTPSERLLQRAAAASFAETADGRLWFASETGLYQVVRGQCHQVTTQGAAREHSFWPLLASVDERSLWVGSLGGGLLQFRPDDNAPPTTNKPRVRVPDSDHTRNVVLSWSGNDTWSVTPPDQLLFSQSLDGATFSSWSSEVSMPFFNAEPGGHELAVRAMDTAGNIQAQATTLSFEVSAGPPPLWARPEMQVAYSVALLALCGLALVLSRRQRERRLDAQARITLNERLRELTRRLMTTQEDERRSLARDLHDDLGQLLTVTTMQIELAEGLEDAQRRNAALELASQSTRQAIDSVRNLAAQIRPTLLDDLGLETAVNATLDDFAASTGLVLERDVLFEHDDLTDSVASHVFRIIKESLTNIVRHAHADRILLRLEVTAHLIEILVQDDGDGFDPERSTSDHGIGLLGMRERAEALGGTFSIDSQAGRGTSLQVTIPLQETQKDGNPPPW